DSARHAGTPPFDGGLVVALGYGLGACLEPHARVRRRPDEGARAVILACDDAWCLDHASGALHAVGSPPALLPEAAPRAWGIDSLHADGTDAAYAAHVARTVEYIRAGDAFQANVARRFSAEITGCARSLAHAAIVRNRAWFGGYLELPDGGALVSMSPELFLRVRADGSCTTRPIKGTRPSDVCASELATSEKDMAELAMIVDLMRNDLGRVAELGSVRVTEGRVLETHRTVHHGVAEIRAQLRPDAGWLDILRATFPPGSVTGAPKVRAMQIIDELEEHPRGFYCGAIGFIARSGNAAMNVAIRTAQLGAPRSDGSRTAHYHAGCGIVADSDPSSEVAETHAKTRAFAQLVR
ncbi:MAG: anthranilate synthase component I family protein, partial [Phycisphaerales bacterium]